MASWRPPDKTGLYDPAFEHDSCGVGFVAHIKGKKSHSLITNALEVLVNLTHRGAVGCDPLTGDGAGILIQTPHSYFREKAHEWRIDLPSRGNYGTGLVFLPRRLDDRRACASAFERIVSDEGQVLLGWRDVPRDDSSVGKTAKESEPVIHQIFIGKGSLPQEDRLAFERRLYVIRKRAENEIRNSDLQQRDRFYVPSLSSRTFVYKGMLLAEQVSRYFLGRRARETIASTERRQR